MQPAATPVATMSVPFTRIPNSVFERFYHPEFHPKSRLEACLVLLVWRLTHGWQSKAVTLSFQDLRERLANPAPSSLFRTIAKLKKKSIFVSVEQTSRGFYCFALKALSETGEALTGERKRPEDVSSPKGDTLTDGSSNSHRWESKLSQVRVSNVINIDEYGVEAPPKERQRKAKKEGSEQALDTDDLCGAQTPQGASLPEPEGFEGEEGSQGEAPREAVAPDGSARRQLFERLWKRYDEAPEGSESASRLGALRWDAARRGDKDKRRLSDFDDRTLIKALGALLAKHNGQRPVKDSSVMLLLLARDIEDGEKSHLPDFTLKHLDFIRQGTPIEELLTDGTSTYRLPDDEESLVEVFQRLLTDGEPAPQEPAEEAPVWRTAAPSPQPVTPQPVTPPTPSQTLTARKERVKRLLISVCSNGALKDWSRRRFVSLHKLSDEAQVEAAIANVLAYLGAYERLCMAGEVAEHVEWASGEWTRVFESEPGDEQDALLTNIHAQLDERGVGQAVEAVA